jgi:hypothetical protein
MATVAAPELADSDVGLDLWPELRFREATGLSAEALAGAVRAGRLILVVTISAGKPSSPLYPSFFADPRYDRDDLEAVTLALGARPAPEKLFWFCRRTAALGGRTPLMALAGGEVEAVLALAQSLAHPLPLRRRPEPVTVSEPLRPA